MTDDAGTNTGVARGDLQRPKSRGRLVLDLPPSCAQFCPTFPNWLVVGTYSLEDSLGGASEHERREGSPADASLKYQQRSGSLLLIKIESYLEPVVMTVANTVICSSAILDLKFSPFDRTKLVVANSNGDLLFYQIGAADFSKEAPPRPSGLNHLHTHPVTSPSTLVLSVAWHPSRENCLGVTTSRGAVRLLYFSENLQKKVSAMDLRSHHLSGWSYSIQAWSICIVNVPSRRETLVFTGGEDSKLIYTRSKDDQETPPVSIASNRYHEAGVTAILSLAGLGPPWFPEFLLTGSYDDHVRLIDVEAKKVEFALDLGGGVWRLENMNRHFSRKVKDNAGKIVEEWHFGVLASCMYAGVRVLSIDRVLSEDQKTLKWDIRVIATFEEHKSMCYASDIQPPYQSDSVKTPSSVTCVSTSFYDRLICLWDCDLSELAALGSQDLVQGPDHGEKTQ